MPKNSQWSFFRNSPNNVSKVLMHLTMLSPLGRSYTYSCSLLLKMWVPYILLKFFQVSCSDLVLKVLFWSFSSSFFSAKDKRKKNSVDCRPYLSVGWMYRPKPSGPLCWGKSAPQRCSETAAWPSVPSAPEKPVSRIKRVYFSLALKPKRSFFWWFDFG